VGGEGRVSHYARGSPTANGTFGPMQITLTPEQENFIQAQLPIGISNSPNAILAEALNLLAQRRRYDNWAQDVQAKVATAAAELERGEGVDGETAIAALKARLHQQHQM
jgi:antitoxin ParD1/3/4